MNNVLQHEINEARRNAESVHTGWSCTLLSYVDDMERQIATLKTQLLQSGVASPDGYIAYSQKGTTTVDLDELRSELAEEKHQHELWEQRSEILELRLGKKGVSINSLKTLLRAWYEWHAKTPSAIVPDVDYWFVAETADRAYRT